MTGNPSAPPARILARPSAFFASVRNVTGSLDAIQVRVLNLLLEDAAQWSIAFLAYGLATAWHEARLRPVEEIGKGAGKPYGQAGHNRGQRAYGRGLVQLTWDRNYERADAELGLHGALVADYSKALDPVIASAVLVRGMAEGWFTTRKLADYFPAERGLPDQFVRARAIINGSDRASLIAGYAQSFQTALTYGGWASAG